MGSSSLTAELKQPNDDDLGCNFPVPFSLSSRNKPSLEASAIDDPWVCFLSEETLNPLIVSRPCSSSLEPEAGRAVIEGAERFIGFNMLRRRCSLSQ